ncbi:hypothetical protein E4T56_gene4053, partial [Termitomyces sp. T112]
SLATVNYSGVVAGYGMRTTTWKPLPLWYGSSQLEHSLEQTGNLDESMQAAFVRAVDKELIYLEQFCRCLFPFQRMSREEKQYQEQLPDLRPLSPHHRPSAALAPAISSIQSKTIFSRLSDWETHLDPVRVSSPSGHTPPEI